MAYTILNTDGSTLLFLADGKIDKAATSLTLVGKNYSGYGEHINNNFVKLLGNFSNDNPPSNPIIGQLWFDSVNQKLKIYNDDEFKSVSGAVVNTTEPSQKTSGDLWWDSTNEQLKVFNGVRFQTVGPSLPKSAGDTGFKLPSVIVRDEDDIKKNIILIRNYGETLGYLSNEGFKFKSTSTYDYLTNQVTTMTYSVKGLNIVGDIQNSGKISNRYLTLEVDIDTLFSTSVNIYNSSHFTEQNSQIAELLDTVYPINTATNLLLNTNSINTLYEIGVPYQTSNATVVCKFSNPRTGYQIRKFETTLINNIGQWTATVITSTSTLTNVVNTMYRI